jgi:hypothetical protein
MLAYDRDPPGMEFEYTTAYDKVVHSIMHDMCREAYDIIEKYFHMSFRESTPLINRLCISLRKEQDWAYGLCEEMDLTDQHIAALKDDVKEMKYLLIYKD